MKKTETVTIVGLMLLAGFIGVLSVLPTEAASPKVLTDILLDTTWAAAGGPYYIEQNVHVATGVKLTIDAGASVYVNGSYNFYVDGTLVVAGTSASPVLITSNKTSPSWGDWAYIRVNSSARLEMDNATVSYFQGVSTDNAAYVRIENCTLHNTTNNAIYVYNTNFPILKNLYLHHTSADLISLYGCDYGNLSNIVTYNDNYRGFLLQYCDHTIMDHLRVDRCGGEGVYFDSCNYCSLNNLTNTYGWGRGIYAGSCQYLKINDAKVTKFNWGWGIDMNGCTYSSITNSSITQANGWSTWNGMYISYCRYMTLKNNYFDMYRSNLEIYAWSGEEFFNHTMSGNYIRTSPICYYKDTTVDLDNIDTKNLMLFKCKASSVKNTDISNGDGMCVWYCNDITVDNCNISSSYYGIRSIASDRLNIKSSSTYQDSNWGIETRWGTYINVTDYISTNDDNGMLFRYNSLCRLENNSVSYTSSGIRFDGSTFSTLKNNTVYRHNDVALFFDGWSEDEYNNTVTQDNTIDGQPTYYYFKKTGISFSNHRAGYIGVFYSRDIQFDKFTLETTMQVFSVYNMNLSDTYIDGSHPWGNMNFYGIWMRYGNYVNITGMNFSNMYSNPVYITYSTHLNVRDCDTYRTYALYFDQNNYINITKCKFWGDYYEWSILGYSTQFLNVSNNLFYKSRYGLYTSSCSDINVTGNIFYWVSQYYTLMINSANRGRIYNNEITGGSSGNAYFEYCSYLNITRNFFNYSNNYGIYMYECDQCIIFLNGFILNSDNAYDNRATSNKWDNGTMGNLWSDYTGIDADHNGIGDTPYDVDSGDTFDNYPLMDPFPPTIRLLSHANNSFVLPGDVIQFEVSDFNLKNVTFKNDTDAWVDFNSPYQAGTDNWGQGSHDILVYANDTMGNEVTVLFHFMVDTIRPDIIMVSPGNDTMTSGTVTLDFNVLDVNLAYVESSIDNAPYAPLGAPYDIITSPAWTEGLHTIKITAMDAAGNGRTSVFLITMDKTPPIIELVSPANQSAMEAGTPIDLSVSDANLGIVQYSLNGVNYTKLTAPFDIDTSLMTGTLRVYVRASDKAGNMASEYYDFTISDSSIPQIVLFSPQDKAIIKPGVILDFGVMDNALASVKVKLNDQAFTDLSAPFDIDTTTLSNGEMAVTIQAEDLSGNTAQKTFTFFIDTQAPDIILLYPLDGKVNAETIIQFKVMEDVALSSVYYSVNKWVLTPMPAGYSISTTAFTEGKNTVDVIATDIAMNEVKKTFEFDMDSLSPSITLMSPKSGSTISQGTPVVFVISDLHLGTVKQVIDGAAASDLATTYTLDTSTWADGWHSVGIIAQDTFGNIANFEARFLVDLTPPVVVSTVPADNATGISIKPQIKIEFSETMDTGVGGTITISGDIPLTARWSNSGTTLILKLTNTLSYNTTYTVTVTALADPYGNSISEYTFDFKTAMAPPTPSSGTDDDDQTTTHPPLPKSDEQMDRQSTKAQKNIVWITIIALIMIGILIAFLMVKLRKKWTSEDRLADEALWRLKEKKRKARIAEKSSEGALPAPADGQVYSGEEPSGGTEEAPADENADGAEPITEAGIPPPLTEDTDFKDADEFGNDEDLELDLPPPIEEEDA